MRVVIKIVVILAIIAALVYGGLRLFAWYMVKEGLDRLKAEISQYVDITYGSIYSAPQLDGTVGVDRIVIRPKMTNDEFRIQSVRISYPGIFKLLTAKADNMPNSMRVSVNGIGIELNSPLLNMISKAQKEKKKSSTEKNSFSSVNIDALGCGSVESIGLEELTRMGYQSIDMDVDADYDYEKIKNLFKLNAVIRLKGMSTVDMKLAMRIAPSDILRRRNIKPVIDYMRFDSSDAGFAVLRNRFCAAQLESTEEVFIGKHIEALSRKVGAIFPEEDVEAYKKTMRGEGHVTVEMTPQTGTELDSIGQYPLHDALDILGTKLTLNGKVVDFSKFDWGKSYTEAKEEGEEGEQQSGSTATSPVPIEHVPATYHATAAKQLKRYVGYQAHIMTRAGVLRDGLIESAESDSITIRLRSSTGKGFISFPIALKDITSAEVLF